MKTLVVTYLPAGARSNTRKLLDAFLAELGDRPVETLDLVRTPAPAFDEASLAAYGKRNYGGQALAPDEARSLARNDALIAQLKAADVVVLAHPMHNFGQPGPVKTWIDAVEFHGETFRLGAKGPEPVMKGRKALTLYTSGGDYPGTHADASAYPAWDTLTQAFKINFGFMGFDAAEVVHASLRDPATAEAKLAEARGRLRAIVGEWYR